MTKFHYVFNRNAIKLFVVYAKFLSIRSTTRKLLTSIQLHNFEAQSVNE